MRLLTLFPVLFLFVVSCQKANRFPEKVTQKVRPETVVFDNKAYQSAIEVTTGNNSAPVNDFLPDSLLLLRRFYQGKNERFSLTSFKNSWEKTKDNLDTGYSGIRKLTEWYNITGLLFELTGESKYIAEMERLLFSEFVKNAGSEQFVNLLKSFIYTKNVDHIHLNFFVPAAIEYNHSLGGKIEIKTETGFTESGSVQLKFSTEEKRYIELYVRIPEWAERTSVKVKKVKYFAKPGRYCKIAKKWKDGDVVDIQFPVAKIPDYLKK